MGYFLHFFPPNSLKNQNSKKFKKSLEISSLYTCVPKMIIRWCMAPEIRCATDGRKDRWTNGQRKWRREVGVPPKKINISNRVQLSLGWKKKENCKPNSLIHALVYRSNIYYSKIYQRENWKNNSSTLHLEVWTKYFRNRYSIKLSRTSMNLKIIQPHQCSLERYHAVLTEIKE